jgi:hypothetical protein
MPSVSEPKLTSDSHKSADAPVVIDMGKKSRKQIKQLREGRGKLLLEVNDVLAELRTAGSITAGAQPVIIVVRQRPRNRSLMWPLA